LCAETEIEGAPAGLCWEAQGANSIPARQPAPTEAVMTQHRIYTTSFASVYPLYVTKAERKGRTKAEVDEIILWLTGYSEEELNARLEDKSDFETFFAQAPRLNPARAEIRGLICGIRVEEVAEPLMREIRYLDKLIDELAKGKAMAKILRG
jgi:hypothetical protein